MRYKVVRSFAGTKYGSYGQGDEMDELPEGVDWVKAGLVIDTLAESAMLAPPKPRQTGRGLQSVMVVRGVGPKMAEELEKMGIEKVVDLAVASPERLAEVKGISPSIAEALIQDARKVLK